MIDEARESRERLHQLAKEYAKRMEEQRDRGVKHAEFQAFLEAEKYYRINVNDPAVVLGLFAEIEALRAGKTALRGELDENGRRLYELAKQSGEVISALKEELDKLRARLAAVEEAAKPKPKPKPKAQIDTDTN